MKKWIWILAAVLTCPSVCGAWSINDYTNEDKAIVDDALTKAIYDIDDNGVVDSVDTGGGSMVYPGAGIPLSTGSAWGTSITDNSANWDAVYSWYSTFDPFETADETDPGFAAWLLATPPLYSESDPAVGTHESTYDHTLIGTALQAEVDGSTTNELQIASTLPVTTTAFDGIFADDTSHDTAQELFDILDDADFGGMANPMTTAGDIIYGGTDGAPTRLAKGANNTFLGLDGSGVIGWQSSLSLDDSAAQFYNASAPTKMAKILCSGITAGQTRTMTWPDADFTPAVLGSNLVPASSYYNFGTVAGSTGYGLRDNAGTMEYKNSTGDWAGIGTGGGGTSAGSQYDIQIADDASGFAAVTGEFKYEANTLYVGTGGMSQAKTSGQAGAFTLYSNNSTDTTGAGLKGPSATLAASYHLIFPSTEPAATAIWAHAAASGHDSAGSWLYPGTSANNLVQLDGDAKLPAVDGSNLTNITSTPNDTETIYDSDGGSISVTKNNTIVIAGAACAVTPMTPAEGVNLMIQNAPGTTGAITLVNLSGVYYGKSDASGYITVNHKYVSGGANTDRIVLIGIDSTHYIVASATGTWTDTAP